MKVLITISDLMYLFKILEIKNHSGDYIHLNHPRSKNYRIGFMQLTTPKGETYFKLADPKNIEIVSEYYVKTK